MSIHAIKHIFVAGLTVEVAYRLFVRERVRAYLGIEVS
jgi:hypothetical protein